MTTTGVTYNHKNGHFWQLDFTGKERDPETGYSYFGARYLDHTPLTLWLSVDPMADKYPSISPYAYCAWNPLKLVDPEGEEINPVFSKEGKLLGTDNLGFSGEAIVMDEKYFWQGMTHMMASAMGQSLSVYGEGIHISDEDWNTVVANGGQRLFPTVSNQSDYVVYYKPEGTKDGININPGYSSSGAYPIAAHTDLYAAVDGVAAPHIKAGVVFKLHDKLAAIVDNNDIIVNDCKLINMVLSHSYSGWKKTKWLDWRHTAIDPITMFNVTIYKGKNADHGWDSLFEISNH
ncbi:MAG: hypothetical protein K5864_03620 [Bacteroidales bacterium]|nr:hypothetical protein [Bacteroidales bacterium]